MLLFHSGYSHVSSLGRYDRKARRNRVSFLQCFLIVNFAAWVLNDWFLWNGLKQGILSLLTPNFLLFPLQNQGVRLPGVMWDVNCLALESSYCMGRLSLLNRKLDSAIIKLLDLALKMRLSLACISCTWKNVNKALCLCIYIYMHLYVRVFVHAYVCVYRMCLYVYVFTLMNVGLFISTYECRYTYLRGQLWNY